VVNLDRLADLSVLDPQSKPIRFGDLWKERPAIIVFLRHFG
jgi:hypothetical protein